MQILLVKTSSMGDLIHNCPVVADIRTGFPDAKIDWVAEEAFTAIPMMHPGIRRVIPVALRRWKKDLFSRQTWQEIGAFKQEIRQSAYDIVLDTQGLLKSALLTRFAQGRRKGYDKTSAREAIAARFYDENFIVAKNLHAVERNRALAAAAFDLSDHLPLDYGLIAPKMRFDWLSAAQTAVLFTASSRDEKLWAEEHWITLARFLIRQGITPILPAGSPIERQRAERIAIQSPGSIAPPSLSLQQIAALTARSKLAVGVDTGLIHLAAALKTPAIALYTQTDPRLTGVHGAAFIRNLGGINTSPDPHTVIHIIEQELP